MILKSADDKSKRLRLLEELQQSPAVDFRQKKWLREQLLRERKGIQGEKDSAYYLDQYFKGGANHVLLHDLRLELDGDVAQIDHLIINRAFGVYLIETKNYAGNMSINDHGEFTAKYEEGVRFGIPSPIEQSQRHERILTRLLDRLEIKNRSGGTLKFFHVVMLHPKAIITRPATGMFDSSNVIKADQFPTWHKRFVNRGLSVGTTLKLMVNMRSLDTIQAWGEKLKRHHQPAKLLDLPEFMQPKRVAPAPAPASVKPVAPECERVPLEIQETPSNLPARLQTERGVDLRATGAFSQAPEKRLICAQCGTKITYTEGKFCWNNNRRFGGLQYCRDHQSNF
jgi:hypothetical protein